MTIPVDGVQLDGELGLPAAATGLVAFAHGNGSTSAGSIDTWQANRGTDATESVSTVYSRGDGLSPTTRRSDQRSS